MRSIIRLTHVPEIYFEIVYNRLQYKAPAQAVLANGRGENMIWDLEHWNSMMRTNNSTD
jgi:hypothetical protein